ncbi:MAG: ABC transporter permease [Actinomycetota bacterium]|nr:ABC transporter permease [Actinomycetota bacterium]
MSAVVTMVRAYLRSRWPGLLSAALLLGVAGGVVLTTAAGARRTDTAYARFLRSSRAADVEIAPSGPGGRQNVGGVSRYYAAVAGLPGVAVVAPTVGVSAVVPGRGNADVVLKAGTDARLGRDIERPKVTRGRMFDPNRPDEVVADRTAANRLHLRVGSVVSLLAGPPGPVGVDMTHATPLTVHVVGVAVTRDNVIPVTVFASQESFLVPPALLRRLGRDTYTYDAAFIRLDPGASVAAFRRRAQALVRLHPETGGQLFVVDEHQQAAKVERGIRPQAVALALFALLVALTAVLAVGQILVREVVIASADHPTLQALGVRPAQLRAAGLAEVGITVAVGAAIAVVAAIVMSPLMPIGPARVAEPDPGVAVNWAILGFGAVAIVVVFALRLAPAVWRLEPEGGSAVKRPSRILASLTRTGAPVTATMGARLALEPGRGRAAIPTRSTVAGAAVAVATLAGSFTFGTNMVRMVNTPRLYGQTWQVSVDVEYDQIPRTDAETFLRKQPGVSAWTFGNHADATIAGRHVFTIALTGAHGPPMFPTLLEGRGPRAPDEIVLGSRTLALTHHHVGQAVTVALHADAEPRMMRIVGRAVFPFFGQGQDTPTDLGDGAALLDPGANPDGFNFFLVGMAHGPSEHDNISRLARNLRAAGVCHQGCRAVTAQRPADVNNYARIKSTPLALAGVLAVLAVATVAHFLVTSIRRRRRDLAVLKSLGFVRRQVSAAVAWQATIITGLSLLIGLPIGVAAGRETWRFFATRLGVDPTPQVPILAVLLSIPAALAIANAVAAAPAWAAGRLRPATVLRAE